MKNVHKSILLNSLIIYVIDVLTWTSPRRLHIFFISFFPPGEFARANRKNATWLAGDKHWRHHQPITFLVVGAKKIATCLTKTGLRRDFFLSCIKGPFVCTPRLGFEFITCCAHDHVEKSWSFYQNSRTQILLQSVNNLHQVRHQHGPDVRRPQSPVDACHRCRDSSLRSPP